MNQPNRYCFASWLLVGVAALSGCDEIVHSNDLPFSLAGIHVGMGKEQLRQLVNFESCEMRKEGETTCPLDDPSKTYLLGGAKVSANVELLDPYTTVDEIWFRYEKDNSPSKSIIEKKWKLEGRCLDGTQLSLLKYDLDDEAIKADTKLLDDSRLLPSRMNDFFCLDVAGSFLLVNASSEMSWGSGQISKLDPVVAAMYEQLIVAKSQPPKAPKPLRNPMIE